MRISHVLSTFLVIVHLSASQQIWDVVSVPTPISCPVSNDFSSGKRPGIAANSLHACPNHHPSILLPRVPLEVPISKFRTLKRSRTSTVSALPSVSSILDWSLVLSTNHVPTADSSALVLNNLKVWCLHPFAYNPRVGTDSIPENKSYQL